MNTHLAPRLPTTKLLDHGWKKAVAILFGLAILVAVVLWIEFGGPAAGTPQMSLPALDVQVASATNTLTATSTRTRTAARNYLPLVRQNPTTVPGSTVTRTPTTTPQGSPPDYSTSFYMLTVDGTKSYTLGCQLGAIEKNRAGVRDIIVILDYGSPKKINNEYGADLFWMGPVTISQITASVQNFSRGFYVCADTDRGSAIYVAVGTTNYGTLMASSTTTAREHGIAWAQMVNNLNSWLVTNGYSSQVHVVGANDIEPAWNGPAVSRAWVDGYDSVNLYDYYDFGTADGCATRSNPTRTACANAWTREDVWYKAYGTRPGFPLPEIYNTYGSNAQQWALLSLYSVNYKGYKIEFHGVLTQMQACQQAGASACVGVDNTPATGWTQLYNELALDARTAYIPRWSSDMRWTNELSGDAAKSANLAVAADARSLAETRVDTLQKGLANSSLQPDLKASLEEKLADSQRLLADRAAGLAKPASKDKNLAPAAPAVGDSGFPVGIFDGAGGMLHAWEGNMTNHWQDSLGTDFVLVSAGNQAEDTGRGLVMVTRVSGDRTRFTRTFVAAPQGVAQLKVQNQAGNTLVMADVNGKSVVFDLATMKFK